MAMNVGRSRDESYFHLYLSADMPRVLFENDEAYRSFLQAYGADFGRICKTYAYCLLPNHVHFLIQTIQPSELDLSTRFCDLLQPYSNDYDLNANLHCVPIRDPALFKPLIRYIHQNPRLHHVCNPFQSWRWSSYQAILRSAAHSEIQHASVLRWFHGADWFEETHWEPVDETKIGYLILKD